MKYANHHGWSDVTPYEVIRVISEKTIEIREMKAERDPSYTPEFVPGGFSAVCTNQRDQQWIITPDDTAPVIRARLRKDGRFWSAHGSHRLNDTPIRFYDYNF